VFAIGDFLGAGYEKAFRRAARKHDLIAVRTSDPRERGWPSVGLVRLRDAETGRELLVDAGSVSVRQDFQSRAAARASAFTRLARGAQADLIEAGTDGNHFDALLGFFRKRDRRRRGHG
jgi:hypothetical protein